MKFPIQYLNSNDGSGILAFGEGERFQMSGKGTLAKLQEFVQLNSNNYIFGFLSYDLKNDIEELKSSNTDQSAFPDTFFWVPEVVVKLNQEHFEFVQGKQTPENLEFLNFFIEEETDQNFHHFPFEFKPRTSKEEYLKTVLKLKDEIQRGNIYEINYCQEFYAENSTVEYLFDAYFKLNQLTKAPFSSFLSIDNHVVLCGSPERFIKREGNKLISQPIKGTAGRGKTESEDAALILALKNDPKERAENVMIVDLVRNDLSKIAEKNSVVVDELCGIYTFETVHQMISTISCQIKTETRLMDVLKATFPMGSMTGAPKLRAMELIEENENFKRGIYSGSVGYIEPNGNFDFNVVIRSLTYNKENKYLSCAVGSAITIGSDPEKEYEECILKVNRILKGMNE